MKTKAASKSEKQVSNDADTIIDLSVPYLVDVTIEGVAPILFHRWSTESVEEKSKAAKNSAVKKTDDVESFLYRTDEGYIGIAGRCFHGAIAEAGRYVPDPRSPRKSAKDLIKAGIVVLDTIAPLHGNITKVDFEDRQRVVIQRASITRTRPAMNPGWKITFQILVNVPST